MSCDLIFKCPINNLSFGQVSYNLLNEMFDRGMDVGVFPIGQTVDIGAFNPSKDFEVWLKDSIEKRYKKLSKDAPSLSLWHLRGSEDSIGTNNYLYTFHELSEATKAEKNIAETYKHVFFSSSFSRDVFGLNSCSYVPIGFDREIKPSQKRTFGTDEIHFSLIGKFEKRKNTARIIKLWNQKYGKNRKYKLSCLINNQFMKPEAIEAEIGKALNGEKLPFNITFLPPLPKNDLVNNLYNATDINLSGLSGGEGWNLPAFNCTALGKWSVVTNYSSHKDWATKENSVLVEPDGQVESEDGIFFSKGDDFNQGMFAHISDEAIVDSFERAEKLAGTVNESGTKLQSDFTYKKTLDAILSQINP